LRRGSAIKSPVVPGLLFRPQSGAVRENGPVVHLDPRKAKTRFRGALWLMLLNGKSSVIFVAVRQFETPFCIEKPVLDS
jgi:hypothetical protein